MSTNVAASSTVAGGLFPPVRRRGCASVGLREILRRNSRRLLVTYVLFNVENVLRLAQPFVLGLAINDLMVGRYLGLGAFVGQHVLFMLTGTLRQMYDTRVFTQIYAETATELVTGQRSAGVDRSRVAARSTLTREFVSFYEDYVPLVIRSLYSVGGALSMLAWYDWRLAPLCLGLLAPAVLLITAYGRRTLLLSSRLHDEYEHEVAAIDSGDRQRVRRHFDALGRWRVKLSDAEALNFCLMELFVLGLLAVALVEFCGRTAAQAGDIFAVFRYLMLFIMGLDAIPRLVQQWSKLRDISRRV